MPTWYENNPEKARLKQIEYRKKYPERVRASAAKCRQKESIEDFLCSSAKTRAKRKNLIFSIVPTDIQVPEFCPVLGILLRRNLGRRCDASPTLDRVDNSKGYTTDNIRVISWRANRLKSDGTLDEFERIVSYIKEGSL